MMHLSRRQAISSLAAVLAGMIVTRPDEATGGGDGVIRSGADRLAADGFSAVAGKRIGLITNHTGRVGDERLIDVMAGAPEVSVAAVLTPEHGLSGQAEAGARIAGGVDVATGIRVHSLYGSAYKPTPEMLAGLDVLVFDMQDVGARFYTYISTMGLAMQAAASAGVPFVVLDRPNPLGGDYVSGFVLDKAFASFVGRFEIPIAHGLTVGELAKMIKGERLLPGLEKLSLDIVEMQGWRRHMRWPETRRPWVATSPNIPTFETALAYAGTGLFEATAASEGRGTDAPFLILGHPSIDAHAIVRDLERSHLDGVSVSVGAARPRVIPGVATTPRFKGREIGAVRLAIKDPSRFQPVETGVALLAAFERALQSAGAGPLIVDERSFDRLAGTDRLRKALARRASGTDVVALWQAEAERFRLRRRPYLAYK